MQYTFSMEQVPEVILDRRPEFAGLYETAWRLAAAHITEDPSMPAPRYMDEAFAPGRIWIWDTCFMTFYCRYAPHTFPGIESLDNFYALLYDGAESGCLVHHPDNPPLFAWAEYEYFKFTGDRARIRRILVEKRYLQRHYEFLETARVGMRLPHCFCLNTLQKNECGYLWSGIASGMDNTPRGNDIHNNLYWLDILAQQALSALYISRLAEKIEEPEIAAEFKEEYDAKAALLNERYFDTADGCYYDLHAATQDPCRVLTPASFWPLLAEAAPARRVARQIATLRDPAKLGGEMPIPSVSRDNRNYHPNGRYWRGGVWLPTSYMTIKALEKYGEFELAAELAERTVAGMEQDFRNCEPHTIHEAYAPEGRLPATTRDGEPVRIDFCGWSALGPIALLIENVIGIRSIDADTMTVELFQRKQGRHGVRNLCFGGCRCDILIDDGGIEVTTDRPLTLKTQHETFSCTPGNHRFTITERNCHEKHLDPSPLCLA